MGTENNALYFLVFISTSRLQIVLEEEEGSNCLRSYKIIWSFFEEEREELINVTSIYS